MNKNNLIIIIVVAAVIVSAGAIYILVKDKGDNEGEVLGATEDDVVELISDLRDGNYKAVYDRMSDDLKRITSEEDIRNNWAVTIADNGAFVSIDNIEKIDGRDSKVFRAHCTFEEGKILISFSFLKTNDRISSFSIGSDM